MRPVASTAAPPAPAPSHKGGPAVRGQARAAEVHALKAQGLSPSRSHWREAAATPAVEVSFSAEATAALAAEAAAPVVDATAPVSTEPAPSIAEAILDAAPAGAAPTEAAPTEATPVVDATAAPSITEAILDAVSTEVSVSG